MPKTMLRLRLYIGMLPVAGLLTLVCLFQFYEFKQLSNRLDDLQATHFSAISEYERISLATSQIERAIFLLEDKDTNLATIVYERSEPTLSEWLAKRPTPPSVAAHLQDELWLLVRNLNTLGKAAFSNRRSVPNLDMLIPLADRIQDVLRDLISKHNDAVELENADFRHETRKQFYVVVSAIIASVALMGFVAYSLSKRILAPIDALARSASQLADDDWDTDFQPSSNDEIAKLEFAFLEMANRIRDYRQHTSRQMIRTRRRMEQCFNNLPHPVLFLNARRQIAYTNPAAALLVENPDWALSLLPALSSRIETVFGTGEEVLMTDFDETVSIHIDAEIVHYLPIFVRVDSDEIEDIECGIVLQDVTRLRLSDDLKSDLVATVSHEIKTPVTSATMALHLLLEKNLGALNEDQEAMINIANSDLNRLRRLLDHFLEIARLEGKSPRLARAPVEAQQLLTQIIEAFALAAQNREITIADAVEPGLPPLEIDFKAMEVALSNLVSNAIKYSPPGSRIEVYARRSPTGLRLGVIDEGPGIPQDEAEKVFDKFYRSPGHSKLDGVGLGLSIVKDIAIAHGGSASCQPRPSGGCDFSIELKA